MNDEWRPDVAAFLADVTLIPDGITERSRWRMYACLRDQLCRLCGWDAPDKSYDHPLYERACIEMVHRLGI